MILRRFLKDVKFSKSPMEPYPLKFENISRKEIWGGESWVLSGLLGTESIIREGPFAGMDINELVGKYPREILGDGPAAGRDHFPLIFKIIDAKKPLSVQVHPDDDYARRHERRRGKTEAWHVIEARPGARITCGLRKKLQRIDIENGIRNGNLENYLRVFEASTGDAVYIPAGTVHSLGGGLVVYEVQEASDVTYRLYDWGRLCADGRPRRLDVEKSLEVINFSDDTDHKTRPVVLERNGHTREVLIACGYFVLEKYCIRKALDRRMDDSFDVITAISGSGFLSFGKSRMDIGHRDTILVPAGLKEYRIDPAGDDLTLLATHIERRLDAYIDKLKMAGIDDESLGGLGGLHG